MAKNDNAHAIRLMDSLRKHIGDDAHDAFDKKYPLSKSADIAKKYEWAKNVCNIIFNFNIIVFSIIGIVITQIDRFHSITSNFVIFIEQKGGNEVANGTKSAFFH